jgi:glycosyltransferase involved in cell wall biosynthesis
MRKGILTLIDLLHPSGAENVAINIAVKLKESSRYRPFVCASRSGGVLEEKLKKNDIEYTVLGRDHSYEIHKFLPLRKIIREKEIRLIHAHKIGSNLWGSLIGRAWGLPVISHFHAHHKSLESLSYLIAAKIINRFSNSIISISEYEKLRLAKEEGITQSKIVTIYNGIDYGNYKSVPDEDTIRSLGIGKGAPVVGFLAAFRPQKDHELLMNSARVVIEQRPDTVFILIGDGETRGKIETMAEELGIKDNCRFTGFRNDIPDLISTFDVAVLSSHWEGLPIAVLEYMASSKPVVCTNVSGMPELVRNGVNGFLVSPSDSGNFAEKIIKLLQDRELAQNMGRKGLETVRSSFSEQKMMKEIENLYDEILNN